jgi:heat shock protein HslJ
MKHYLILAVLFFMVSCGTHKVHKTNKSNEYIYWVNSAKVPCEGVGAMQCLKVQKGDTLNSEEWQLFYSTIDGFDYQPGYIYKLIVREEKIEKEKVPADASSIKFKLVKVLEKKQDVRLRINDIWVLVSINGEAVQQNSENKRQKTAQIEFNIAEMRVLGNDGCNNFFGSIKNIDSEELILGPLAGTRMACLGTDIPDKFNVALNNVGSYKIENMQLTLSDVSGKELLVFRKID